MASTYPEVECVETASCTDVPAVRVTRTVAGRPFGLGRSNIPQSDGIRRVEGVDAALGGDSDSIVAALTFPGQFQCQGIANCLEKVSALTIMQIECRTAYWWCGHAVGSVPELSWGGLRVRAVLQCAVVDA